MLICRVDGCDREVHYLEKQMCQRHYFRLWRYGTTELTRAGKRKQRVETSAGYQWIYLLGHPLRHRSSGYVAEHRAVLYADLGDGPLACELCGKQLTWRTCHVDHIDNDTRNNKRDNLRPTCSTCNTRRGMRPAVEWDNTHKVEFQDERMTPAEWARDPRINVAGNTIIRRKSLGATDEQALFGAKKTHNGKKPPPRTRAAYQHVYLSARGKTMTRNEWTKEPGVSVSGPAIRRRLKLGWDVDKAIFEPASDTGAQTRAKLKQLKENT